MTEVVAPLRRSNVIRKVKTQSTKRAPVTTATVKREVTTKTEITIAPLRRSLAIKLAPIKPPMRKENPKSFINFKEVSLLMSLISFLSHLLFEKIILSKV